MPDRRERLARCFSAVFPHLSLAEIERASSSSVAGWDSIAMINLMTVIEEEMGVSFDPDELERLVSFELILDVLREKAHEDGP